ncbi:MAG: RNA polymerase factor sigma-54 [Parvularculaceae bacterium]|nr:RNA polymerase factor sigma-54 [Parvularculaceae bacterium]
MKLTGRLEARQSQQLTMTPQLQQAIKLLQMSNIELQDFVDERLLENPFLERGENPDAPEKPAEAADKPEDLSPADGSDDPLPAPKERIRENASSSGGGGEDYDAAANISVEKTLREVLEEQLVVHFRDPMELGIGRYLVDLVEDSGYITTPTEVVAERLGCPVDDVEFVLQEIQGFDPAGVGARSLGECLKLQLREGDGVPDEMELLLDNLALLGSHKIAELKKITGMSDDDLREAVGIIRTLNPKPGLAYGSDPVQVVVPDVYVAEGADGSWRVELNSETLPRVIANEQYYTKLSKVKQPDDSKEFLQNQMGDANWLVRSLDQRARTILKVSSEIVRYQDGFFAEGIRFLKPLNLKKVADAIEMHESTVSRVTTGKYMHTPRGVFEMKYFFTAAIPSSAGDQDYSAESVRHVIKSLIDKEDPLKPLSDDQLVGELAKHDMAIARRTVAKYRVSLDIPSSVERKRAAKQAI